MGKTRQTNKSVISSFINKNWIFPCATNYQNNSARKILSLNIISGQHTIFVKINLYEPYVLKIQMLQSFINMKNS